MQTRQEAIQYCHSFKNVYEDYPFHDDNWCVMLLMLSWVVMISPCHAVMRLPGYLSWNVPFDGAAVRPITEEISSYIHALPAL